MYFLLINAPWFASYRAEKKSRLFIGQGGGRETVG